MLKCHDSVTDGSVSRCSFYTEEADIVVVILGDDRMAASGHSRQSQHPQYRSEHLAKRISCRAARPRP